jgi:hypothetical protein
MESTLAILVHEAEGLVQPFRDRYDPSAKAGDASTHNFAVPFQVS